MRLKCHSRIAWLVGIVFVFVGFSMACERPFQVITFKNDTLSAIQADAVPVQKDWDGKAIFKWRSSVLSIEPSQTQAFVTSVSPARDSTKYLIQAVNQNNELVFSKIYTWDELHDSGWRVVITATIEDAVPSENTAMNRFGSLEIRLYSS
jgi:hypothetical protein